MEKKRSGPVRPAEKAEPVQEVGLMDLLLIAAAIVGALTAFALVWKRIVRT